jgi:hypothetical protein
VRYINWKKFFLLNTALCLCALILAVSAAEYALRKIDIEGLSGYKMYLGEIDSRIYFSLMPYVETEGKLKRFTLGNCYPSNPGGSFTLMAVNPFEGKTCCCVLYDGKKRRQGFNPERKRQIVLVGDSFTFGEGVKETQTLGYFLNEQYRDINFQNWGKIGATMDDVTKICEDVIASGQPVEEVIYFYHLNDVRMSEKVFARHMKLVTDFQGIRWPEDKNDHDSAAGILSRSALFSTARKAWLISRQSILTVQDYRDMYLNESNRPEFLSTMDEIQTMKDRLAARGISFRVVIYPLLYKDLLGRYPFEQIHEVIMNECRKRSVACLDGYAPFKSHYSMKKFAVHPVDYHPNGLCNYLLADYLREKDFIAGKTMP